MLHRLPACCVARVRLYACRSEVPRHMLGRLSSRPRLRRGVVGGAFGRFDTRIAPLRVRGAGRRVDVADGGVEQLGGVSRRLPPCRGAFPGGHVLSGCGLAQRPMDRYGRGDGWRLALCHMERVFRARVGRPHRRRVASDAGGYPREPHVGQPGAAACGAACACGREPCRAGREGRPHAVARRRCGGRLDARGGDVAPAYAGAAPRLLDRTLQYGSRRQELGRHGGAVVRRGGGRGRQPCGARRRRT